MSSRAALVTVLLCIVSGTVEAEIVGVAGGYGPPGPTLGPYEITPFPLDERPLYELVMDVPSPFGGNLEFSTSLQHLRVGQGWVIGGHGYAGDVYAGNGVSEFTLTLPGNTYAFYLYADQEPHDLPWPITAIADDGTTIVQDVSDDLGTAYFGFYQDDPLGPPIASISVSSPYVAFLAVGEFGIAIPAPGVLALVGISAVGAISGRRRRRSLVGRGSGGGSSPCL